MYPQHLIDADTTRRHPPRVIDPKAPVSRPAPSSVPTRTRRAVPSVLRALGLTALLGVAGFIAVTDRLDVRVVIGSGGRRSSTTLGQMLADVAAGRHPWPPSTRWVCALALAVLLLAVLFLARVVTGTRRRHRENVTGRGDLPIAAGSTAPSQRLASVAVTAPADRRSRRARLRSRLQQDGLDALLVTDLINLRYLTGFTGSNGALLVGAAGPGADSAVQDEPGTVFCTDGRYLTQSAMQVPDLERVIDRPVDLALLARAAGRVGLEARAVTVAQHAALVGALSERAGAVELTATVDLVEDLRVVKDAGEIDSLRRACAVADRALAELIAAGGLRPGLTERAVGLDLDQRMRMLGASDPAFETIVAAGANGAVPHHRPDATVLAAGDLVTLDFGAVVDGYHSDMTRTIALGRVAGWQRDMYDLVARAQAVGREAVRPGALGSSIDAASRAVIAEAGRGELFLHGLGHGVGLQVHEAPGLAASATGKMSTGMCVTVEPGVYLAGHGGVRIEDSGVVRPDGYEVLTTTSRELIEI